MHRFGVHLPNTTNKCELTVCLALQGWQQEYTQVLRMGLGRLVELMIGYIPIHDEYYLFTFKYCSCPNLRCSITIFRFSWGENIALMSFSFCLCWRNHYLSVRLNREIQENLQPLHILSRDTRKQMKSYQETRALRKQNFSWRLGY